MKKLLAVCISLLWVGTLFANPDSVITLADKYWDANEMDSARLFYQKGLLAAKESKDTLSQILGIKGLLNVHRRDRELIDISEFRETLRNFSGTKHYEALMRSQVVVGMYLFQIGRYEESISHLDSVYLLLSDTDKKGYIGAGLLSCKGDSYNQLLQFDQSMVCYEQSLKIYDELGLKEQILRVKSHVAIAKKELGQIDEAIVLYKEILRDSLTDDITLLNTLNNLAVVYNEIKEFDSAKVIYFRAADLAKELKLRGMENLILNNLSNTLEDKGNLEAERAKNRGLQRNILILFIVFVSIIFVLSIIILFNRLKQQKKLNEQAQKLHEQEMNNILQDQELSSINAQMQAMKQERDRVAKDLHDRLGGMMGALRINFDQIAHIIKETKPDLAPKVESTTAILNESCDEIRKVAHNMAISSVAQFGLVQALNRLVKTINDSGKIAIEFSAPVESIAISSDKEMEIYKIVQEALSNVLRHANAKEADVHITANDHINIVIEDDGKGFDPEKMRNGLGIQSMEQRIAKLSGVLNIDSSIGRGTTIIVDIPMS